MLWTLEKEPSGPLLRGLTSHGMQDLVWSALGFDALWACLSSRGCSPTGNDWDFRALGIMTIWPTKNYSQNWLFTLGKPYWCHYSKLQAGDLGSEPLPCKICASVVLGFPRPQRRKVRAGEGQLLPFFITRNNRFSRFANHSQQVRYEPCLHVLQNQC